MYATKHTNVGSYNNTFCTQNRLKDLHFNNTAYLNTTCINYVVDIQLRLSFAAMFLMVNYVTRAERHLLDQAHDDNDNTLLSLREGGGGDSQTV